MFDIKLTYSSVGHLQSNDNVERFHFTLFKMIRVHKYEHPEKQFNILLYAVTAYNISVNKTHEYRPHQLTLYDRNELM